MGFLARLFGSRPAAAHTNLVRYQAYLVDPSRRTASLDIVGESNYQAELMKIAGGRTPAGPAIPDHLAILTPEPTNPYDRNAIAIQIEAELVGYLSRGDALAYGQVTRWAQGRNHVIACHARLTGGWDNGVGGQGSIGVVLHIGTPAECMMDLALESPPRTEHQWVGQTIAFTGESTCRVGDLKLDREASVLLAQRAGIIVHPRLTKKVHLLVDCDSVGVSANQARAIEYGIPVVDELTFWQTLGVSVQQITW